MILLSNKKALVDFDYELLSELMITLDQQWDAVLDDARKADELLTDLYMDRAEYLAGLGLVACQRYIGCTYPQFKLERKKAMGFPPLLPSGQAIAGLLDAGANYWKHAEERHYTQPHRKLHDNTLEAITKAGLSPEDDYVCRDIMELVAGEAPRPFSRVAKALIEWRTKLIQTYGTISASAS
jgi:hypothetical protein